MPLLSEPDTGLADGDLIKLDLGAHIDSFIAVVPRTPDCRSFSYR